MIRLLILFLIILLALVSLGGFLFMSEKISVGQKLMADGQIAIEKGEPKLDEGKARLKAGRLEASDGKKEYKEAEDNLLLLLMDNVFNGGDGFADARERISKGDKQVSQGEADVEIGEKRLKAGKLELRLGGEQLMLAKGVRIGFALSTCFFTSMLIVFCFLWRRMLARIFYDSENKKNLISDTIDGK